MSVLEEIRKLDEQKAKLLEGAKIEALSAAKAAISTLAELGFNYTLVQGEGSGAISRTPGTRRTGIREEVLALVKANPGATRSSLIAKMNIASDKSGQQSLSNALAALKKAGTVSADGGAYTAR